MTKIAISGNIAAGKSVVENFLKESGFTVYDTDIMAHEILENSNEIKLAFKDYDIVSDGKIDRKKLGAIVFQNSELKSILEQIIHPQIRNKIENLYSSAPIFIAVPLLFEANMQDLFDKIIFVTADEKIRLERLMERNSLTKEEALLRIHAQENEENKIKQSDFIIYNNTDLVSLKNQLSKVLHKLQY